MGQFEYQAVDGSGEHVSGVIQAADRRSAVAMLSQKGQFVTRIAAHLEEQSAHKASQVSAVAAPRLLSGHKKHIAGKDLLELTNQLSAALRAGLPLIECLRVVQKQMQKPAIKNMLGELIDSVNSGSSLSESLEKQGRTFSTLYKAMIRVGEMGGILEDTTEQLANLLKREEKIKSNIRTASAYPAIVMVVGIISVIFIMTIIIPRIVTMLGDTMVTLPLPTQVMMWFSEAIKHYGWGILIGLVLAWLAFRQWTRTESGRYIWDGFKLHIPVLGRVIQAIAVGRFARTLGALSKGGITILEALQVVRNTMGNEKLGREIDKVTQKIRTGESLAEPLEQSGIFPPLLVQIVSVGEQTGKLDELLLNAANTFDEDADASIARFMAVMPAVLVLVLAVIVGFIVAGAILPIVVMQLGAVGV